MRMGKGNKQTMGRSDSQPDLSKHAPGTRVLERSLTICGDEMFGWFACKLLVTDVKLERLLLIMCIGRRYCRGIGSNVDIFTCELSGQSELVICCARLLMCALCVCIYKRFA